LSAAHGAPPRGLPSGASDTLTLTVGGHVLSGWQRVTVTRPLAAIPAAFDLQVTEKFPSTPDIDIKAGAPCTVQIGADLVLTGYVDRYSASISRAEHTIRVNGRSKSQDLVDCSAVFGDINKPGFQVVNSNTLAIAKGLAAPYSIDVQSSAGDGVTIPQFNINLGESPWDIIDRVTRYSQMLVYDQPDGSIMLAAVGKDSMASGVSIGPQGNCESGQVALSMDGRFSEYEGHLTSILTFGTDAGIATPDVGKIVRDEGVPRFRKRYVISEQSVLGVFIVNDRAVWEMNRRMGQSYQLDAVVDSWRDSAGKLWQPNMLIPISAPVLKLSDVSYIIASVSYVRDEYGQHADLRLMPREAFFVEPVGSLGYVSVEDATSNNNPTQKQVDTNLPTDRGNQPTSATA
jgi:prophage tail gpP-like protein